jgi:hypothetical protein
LRHEQKVSEPLVAADGSGRSGCELWRQNSGFILLLNDRVAVNFATPAVRALLISHKGAQRVADTR